MSRALFATLALVAVLVATPLLAATETAQYRVRFDATWSAESHPTAFPSNPHFSDLIGGVHNAEVSFWQPGQLASTGIKEMAERGRVSPLDGEVLAAVETGAAREVIRGGNIAVSPGSATTTFTVSQNHPLATVVTMIAPSPDWFVGVNGLSLFENGDWVEQKKITVFGWDAGTDSGTYYDANNLVTSPFEPISALTSGIFEGRGSIGTFTFTRLDSPPPPQLLLGAGRFRVELEYEDYEGTRGRGLPATLTADTGYFHFFDVDNVEMVIKVLNGCAINQHYWVFAGGLTDIGIDLEVIDTVSGQRRAYHNDLGDAFTPVRDSLAFPCN